MAKENSSGLGVFDNYGPRKTEESRSGELPGFGTEREYRFSFNGEEYADITGTIPAGSIVKSIVLKVIEPVTASADVLIGTEGEEVTNGAVLEVADLAAEGSYVVPSIGTWAAGKDKAALAADTPVSLVSSGTVTGGKAVVVVRTYRAA